MPERRVNTLDHSFGVVAVVMGSLPGANRNGRCPILDLPGLTSDASPLRSRRRRSDGLRVRAWGLADQLQRPENTHAEDVMNYGDSEDRPVPGIKPAEKRCAQERKDAELQGIVQVEHAEFR
jgi:hypothetical protein